MGSEEASVFQRVVLRKAGLGEGVSVPQRGPGLSGRWGRGWGGGGGQRPWDVAGAGAPGGRLGRVSGAHRGPVCPQAPARSAAPLHGQRTLSSPSPRRRKALRSRPQGRAGRDSRAPTPGRGSWRATGRASPCTDPVLPLRGWRSRESAREAQVELRPQGGVQGGYERGRAFGRRLPRSRVGFLRLSASFRVSPSEGW